MKHLGSKFHCSSVAQSKFFLPTSETGRIIWISDLHFDNPQSERAKLKKILKANPTAYIVIGGDAFDLMEAFGDPRGSRDRQKKQGYGTDWGNSIVEDFVQFFLPFAKRILYINTGNHESSFAMRHGFDLPLLAATRLNKEGEANILCGDYAGYIELVFQMGTKTKTNTQMIYFSHSSGSVGKRSKGTLAIDIIKGQHPSADIVMVEHDHETYIHPSTIEIFDSYNKKLKNKRMWFCSVPTVKDESTGHKRGFHHEKNMGKRTTGCIALDFFFKTTKNISRMHCEPRYLLF